VKIKELKNNNIDNFFARKSCPYILLIITNGLGFIMVWLFREYDQFLSC
jgi:hypothetical protein